MRIYVLPVLMTASAALAQSSVIIDVEDAVLMPGESTTVTLRGAIVQWEDYALAFVATNLFSSTGSDGWSDMELIRPMDFIGTSPGLVASMGVEGIQAAQPNWPIGSGADTSNPIAFWRATYTAPLDASTPFDVVLSTRSSEYAVYLGRESTVSVSRLSTLTEGSATIHVIPAPAGPVVLGVGALGVFATGRRRR